ncbi:MAG: polysaccharide deacetylase family protein [Elusimicrobia bacterium]|nr:polysaccharide deacetylase family protein [Elusimicrobiota bacterium]
MANEDRGRHAWHPWAQAALLPLLLLSLQGIARQAPRAPIISITFDDGNADQLMAVPMLSRHGLKATFFVNAGRIGQDDYLTRGQLRSLQSAGHEIGGHSLSHPRLIALTEEELRREVCVDRSRLLAWGLSAQNFAYPFGEYDGSVQAMVRSCGYATARAVGNASRAAPYPPPDPYALAAPASVAETDAVEHLKRLVLDAERTGGWLILTFHHVCGSCGTYGFTPEKLSEFLDWLGPRNGQSLSVQTVAEATGTAPPQGVPPPPPQAPVAPSTAVRAYPNPWRADLHEGRRMTIDRLGAAGSVRIFTPSGRHVRTLSASGGAAAWDLADHSGTGVSSGLYLYVAVDGQGRLVSGTVTVIR